jgi:sulfonate transport system ATP-binding protein
MLENVMSVSFAQRIRADVAPAPVHLRSVFKSFTRARATNLVLADVSIDVVAGEVVALLGPSGCGKSTLLRLIAGLESATSGSVEVDGHEVTSVDARCSLVFQEPRLLPWRSISDNVALGARGKVDADELERLLFNVGLGGFARHYPRQVSGGMAQRAALARALIGSPGVLLLDEPFAALDALTRLQMQDLVADVVAETGATVIFVTHDIDEALHLADRVVVLGHRGEGISAVVNVPFDRPRDRSHPGLAPLRTSLLSHFGIHH